MHIMTDESINQYDIIELKEDINPKIKKGMIGVILEKFTEEDFLIEVLSEDGFNIEYNGDYTYSVKKIQIVKKK
jgi:hypothetical protein